MRNVLRKWKEQKSNKGSSLVMVMAIVAIVGVLAFTLLTVSLITYRMKNTNMNSKKNFYDAEKVLDNISIGLQHDISQAVGSAYAWTLENFSSATEDTRQANYISKFQDELLNEIQSSGGSSISLHYDLDHLRDMVSSDITDTTKNPQFKSLSIVSADGNAVLNQDSDKGTLTLKNVQVTYQDTRNYVTQIRTDIVLSCPKIDFSQMNTTPLDLTAFALVANQKATTSGNNIAIKGSAYLGNEGADINSPNVTFSPLDGGSRLITADNLRVGNGASLKVDDGIQTWARGISLYGGSADIDGITYINNDIVLSNPKGSSSSLTMKGRLYAYGNPASASNTAEIYSTNDDGTSSFKIADTANHPADFSSSVLINGTNAVVDFSGLDEMILSGNAYVGTSLKDNNTSDIQMGESLSLKSDQRAYLVPAEFIAPYCNKYGGRNPMSAETYAALCSEAKSKLGKDTLSNLDFVRPDKNSLENTIPEKLSKYGVTDIKMQFNTISLGTGSNATTVQMVYFFLVFKDTYSANKFAQSHYALTQNLSTIKGTIYPDYDTDGTNDTMFVNKNIDITYPNNFNGNSNFYYNGCVLVPDGDNTKFYPGCLAQADDGSSSDVLTNKERAYQNSFASLRHKLVPDAGGVSDADRAKTVYQYLVVPDMNDVSGKKKIAENTYVTFSQELEDGTKVSAVVANGNYVLKKDNAANIHVIIASGDVSVEADCDYQGLIIAGGTVSIAQEAKLTANSALAQQALRIKDEASGTCAADYLNNGNMFVVGGTEEGDEGSDDGIHFDDYVTYNNWVKQ